ncbi:MAG: hypothetical protein DMF52_13555 [Acidobacteria bacterium]|nr:MAG: hypothetical protein DMF52_13555 [Acidobacteriota bacterium]
MKVGLMSIAGLVILFGCLIGLLALIAAPIVLALLIVGSVLRLVLFVLVLPFRLLGAMIGLGLSSVGWLLKGPVFFAGLALLFLLVALPLLPLLLVAGAVYMIFRAMRPRSAPVGRA